MRDGGECTGLPSTALAYSGRIVSYRTAGGMAIVGALHDLRDLNNSFQARAEGIGNEALNDRRRRQKRARFLRAMLAHVE